MIAARLANLGVKTERTGEVESEDGGVQATPTPFEAP